MNDVLTFDIGKTGCRVALWRNGIQVGMAQGPGAVGVADPDGVDQAVASTKEALDRLQTRCSLGDVGAVAVGLAGMASAPHRRVELLHRLEGQHPGATVLVTSDAVLSHVGALAGNAGVVLAAGTGATALAVAADGRYCRVDGWGYLLGDAGSGYAIGRAGLEQALREHDGRGGSPGLMSRARERWPDLSTLPAVVHGAANPAQVIASFARDVFAAAEEGDVVAVQICETAGVALAESIVAAARGAGLRTTVTMSTTGGLFGAGPVLTDPFERHLAEQLPGIQRQAPHGDALTGGYLFATRPDLPHHRIFNNTDEGATT